MQHELKTLPCYYMQTIKGDKPFEIRDNSDRSFQKGETVILMEFDPKKADNLKHGFTGKEASATISCVIDYAQKENYVVIGLTDIKKI